MVARPDYGAYKLIELYQAMNSIIADRYPDNFTALVTELESRDANSLFELEECYYVLDKNKWPAYATRLREQIGDLKKGQAHSTVISNEPNQQAIREYFATTSDGTRIVLLGKRSRIVPETALEAQLSRDLADADMFSLGVLIVGNSLVLQISHGVLYLFLLASLIALSRVVYLGMVNSAIYSLPPYTKPIPLKDRMMLRARRMPWWRVCTAIALCILVGAVSVHHLRIADEKVLWALCVTVMTGAAIWTTCLAILKWRGSQVPLWNGLR